jgi:PAS domain S-box-containing protein
MPSLGHESGSKHLERIIDSIPSLIHTARPDGYLDYFNQRWLQYVGLPIEDLLGSKWTAVIHPEDVAAIVEKWRLSLTSGEPFLHEARVRRADGEYRWMLHHKVAVRDEFGQIVKWWTNGGDALVRLASGLCCHLSICRSRYDFCGFRLDLARQYIAHPHPRIHTG